MAMWPQWRLLNALPGITRMRLQTRYIDTEKSVSIIILTISIFYGNAYVNLLQLCWEKIPSQ